MRRGTVVNLLLVAVLLVSLLAVVFVYQRGREYYLQLNATKLDPPGLGAYDTDALSDPEPGRIRVVFFGDSRARAWPAPPGLADIEFINRGIDNQTSAQILGRFDNHVRTASPQVVIVQACINDLKAIPLFPERRASIVADCMGNIEQIVSESEAQGADVILATIFPLGEVPLERKLFWSDDVADAIDEVNVYLFSLEKDGVVVMDTDSILADGRGVVRNEYSRDLLHLTEEGYDALNKELVRILKTLE